MNEIWEVCGIITHTQLLSFQFDVGQHKNAESFIFHTTSEVD